MSRLGVAVVAVCGVAVGVLVMLVVDLFTAQTSHELRRDRDRLAARVAELETTPAVAPVAPCEAPASRGPAPDEAFDSILSRAELERFLIELASRNVWDPKTYWALTGPFREFHMMLTVVGEGKVYLEGVIHPQPTSDGLMPVSVMFRPGELADLDAAYSNRNRVIIRLAQAAGLTSEELNRLVLVLVLTPLVQGRVEEAVMQFSGGMPQRVRQHFLECMVSLKTPGYSGAKLYGVESPAIGFPLSERCVADVVFAGSDIGIIHSEVNYAKMGPWWSIVLHSAKSDDFTQSEASPPGILEWPRLTEEEMVQFIDAIVSKPKQDEG